MSVAIQRELGELNMGIDLWIKRANEMFVASYRDLVWDVFVRILEQTPQYSGKAVANWNIGVGSPDYSFDDSLGTGSRLVDEAMPGSPMFFGNAPSFRVAPHKRGDKEWIEVAKQRNAPKIKLIKRETRVYFNNAVRGDNDGGATATNLYMEELQNPEYWDSKLRAVNKDYETAQESLIFLAVIEGSKFGTRFRPGGTNYQQYL